jgi:DNA-binding transcriptional ArsR family regulator
VLSVAELCRALAVRRSLVSRQLTLLPTRGLIQARRDGQQVYYRLASAAVPELLRLVCRLAAIAGAQADESSEELE